MLALTKPKKKARLRPATQRVLYSLAGRQDGIEELGFDLGRLDIQVGYGDVRGQETNAAYRRRLWTLERVGFVRIQRHQSGYARDVKLTERGKAYVAAFRTDGEWWR